MKDLRERLANAGFQLFETELQQVCSGLDTKFSGLMEWKEFLKAFEWTSKRVSQLMQNCL